MTQTLVPSDCELLVIISFFRPELLTCPFIVVNIYPVHSGTDSERLLQLHQHQAILMFKQAFILLIVNITSGFHIHGAPSVCPSLSSGFPTYLWSNIPSWLGSSSMLVYIQNICTFLLQMTWSYFRNPGACDIPTDACHKVHIASFSTNELSNTIWSAGSSEWQKCLHCGMNLVPRPS